MKLRLLDSVDSWSNTVDFDNIKLLETDKNWNIINKKRIPDKSEVEIYHDANNNYVKFITLSLFSMENNYKNCETNFFFVKKK